MRLYRALLAFYPASFRRRYGAEMLGIFARRRREAAGPLAVAALWVGAAADILANGAAAHWDLLLQDLRSTGRSLRRSPGFAATALAVVALGVGANTAVFSVTDFVLIRPLPFARPERLVKLWERLPGYSQMEPSPANYRDWKRMSTAFAAMGAFSTMSFNVAGQGEPLRLEGAMVTADLLPLLGVAPVLGRLFTSAEDRPGTGGTLLLSHQLWREQFGGDRGVLGRRLTLDGSPFVVIGVMPRSFQFPSPSVRFWMPARLPAAAFEDRNDNWLEVVARLRHGVSLGQAKAEMGVVAAGLARQYPKENSHTGVAVLDLRDDLSRQSRLLLVALAGAALCVLLIACANLAGLLMARSLARRQELELRTALGAGRERLVRQLVTESLVLALSGGGLGVMVAGLALPLLTRLVPAELPLSQAPAIDLRALGFAALLTTATGIAFGLAPAVRVCRAAGLAGLREGSRAGGGRRQALRTALVTGEVAASVVLLITSGLLIRALWRVQTTDPGFRAAGVLTLRTSLPQLKYPAVRRAEFYHRVLSGARALPGVGAAAYASAAPLTWRGGIWPVALEGQPAERDASRSASLRFVSPGYFTTLSIPLLRGRDLAEADTAERPLVALVSESFVRRYWPDQEPLGRRFQFGLHQRTVVGVVGDVRVRGLERSSEPQVYLPYLQALEGELFNYVPKDLILRVSAPGGLPAGPALAGRLLPRLRRIIHEADPELPVSDVRMMEEIVADETAPRTVEVRVLGAFASVALVLAAIGIHGLLAFSVAQRAREIGVRRALGARTGSILALILRGGALPAAAGVLPGLALAYAAGRALQGLLAGVEPGDLPTFTVAGLLCLLMALSGSLAPALRAVRVDPITVVRTE